MLLFLEKKLKNFENFIKSFESFRKFLIKYKYKTLNKIKQNWHIL